MDADYSPDLVLVEPSGAADPHSILRALPYYRGIILESIRTISVLEALRLEMLVEVMTSLMVSQIQCSSSLIHKQAVSGPLYSKEILIFLSKHRNRKS